MARIRTNKPEFPQSESIGNLSRDARLLFIQLWTLADDQGRGRGATPVLIGALYPYDGDASGLINDWLQELITAGCIVVYQHDGTTYFQVVNWALHQKIDKPSPSRYPAPDGAVPGKITERDIEASIHGAIMRDRKFAGQSIVDIQRQVRIGSSYLDLVVKTDAKTFVIEVKRDRITGADLAQVKRYCELVGGVPVLIGAGLSPKLSFDECTKSGVAIATYDQNGAVILVPSENVIECSITFSNVIERQSSDLGPRTLDLGPSTKDHKPTLSAITTIYFYENQNIRLNEKDFRRWETAYTNLNLRSELEALANWDKARGRGWFNAVAGALTKKNRDVQLHKESVKIGIAAGQQKTNPDQVSGWDRR